MVIYRFIVAILLFISCAEASLSDLNMDQNAHKALSLPDEIVIEDEESLNKENPVNLQEAPHWGLTHWLHGIPEYITRILCCNNVGVGDDYQKRQWLIKRKNLFSSTPSSASYEQDIDGTDCCCLTFVAGGKDDSCALFCLFLNPIGLAACSPLAALCHLCWLPVAWRLRTEQNPHIIYRYIDNTPISPLPWYEHPNASTEELVRAAAKKQLRGN